MSLCIPHSFHCSKISLSKGNIGNPSNFWLAIKWHIFSPFIFFCQVDKKKKGFQDSGITQMENKRIKGEIKNLNENLWSWI